MIDIVILCPLSIEYNAVRKYLANISFKQENQFNLSYEEGQIISSENIWNIALFETGGKIGNLQARTTQILHSLKPNYIFLVGIAAGIKDVGIGDVIVGTKAYGYESGKETDEGFLARPDVIYSSRNLLELAKQVARETTTKNYKIEFGAIAGGNRVINTDKNSLKVIKQSYNDTKALEMESIGFSFAAQEAKVPFLNVRSICDLAVNKNDNFQASASDHAAEFAIQIIKRLPSKETLVPVQTIPVHYTRQPFKIFEWRKMTTTELLISKAGLRFQINGKFVNTRKLKTCKHIKMKGDFSKNWILVELSNNEIFYFSQQSFLPGIRNIFGGNKELLKELNLLTIKS